MAAHVVYTRPMQIINGSVVNKNDATISQMMNANMEMRIISDSDVPNSSENPTIEDYLIAEESDGYYLAHMDNTIIVTSTNTGGGGGGDVSSVFGRTGDIVAVDYDYDADQVEWAENHNHINNVGDVIDHIWSAGVCKYDGGLALTDNGNGTVDITDGSAVLRTADSKHANLVGYNITGVNNLGLTDAATNIVYLDYNGGSPIIDVTTDVNDIFIDNTKIGIYAINRLGNTLYVIDYRSYNVDYAKTNSFKDFYKYGIEHASGSAVADEGSSQFSVTAGLYYVSSIEHETNTLDTSDTGTFEYIYRDGLGGWTRVTGQTDIDNANYDDGSGALASVSAGYFVNHFVYLILDSTTTTYKVVYETAEHATLADAQAADNPSDLPSDLDGNSNAILISRIISEQGVTAFADILDPFVTVFTSSTASNHNSLAGLQGGAAGDYQHLTTAEAGQIATNTSDIANKVSLTGDESIDDVKTFTTPIRLSTLNTGDNIITTDTDGDLQESGATVTSAPAGGSGLGITEYASAPVAPPAGFIWVQAKDASTKTLNYYDGSNTYNVDLSV